MQGFRLTQEAVDEGFSGGSIKANDEGRLFNIGEALTEEDPQTGERILNTGKIIVVEDDILGEVLSGHPSLERVAAEAVPGDMEPVRLPTARGLLAGDTPPYTPQTNNDDPAQPTLATAPSDPYTPQTNDIGPGADLSSPVIAEHADEPDTVEGALAAGERVSGQTQQEGDTDSEEQDAEATDSDPAEEDE